MILNAYYDCLRRLLGEGDTDKRITHVGLGTGTDAPNKDDATLSQDAILIPVNSVSYAGERGMTVQFELADDQANGMAITEIGLLTTDGTLIFRALRSEPIHKTSDMRVGDSIELQI